LAEIYDKSTGYFATAESDLSKTSPNSALYLHEILSKNGLSNGRFLDVGCSTGRLLYHMRNLGWNVAGIDVDPDAIQIAINNKMDVQKGELEDSHFQENSFDAVHMGDVLEHVRSPFNTLVKAHGLLKAGGFIIINTPNVDCGLARSSLLLSKVSKFPWPHSEAPLHLYEFSVKTLASLLSRAGFELTSTEYSGFRSFSYTVGGTGFFDELKASMKQTGKYRVNMHFIQNIPKLAIVSSVILPFHLFGRLYDKALKTGPKIFVVARRVPKNTPK
jgi:SAM-dependent methyltransferase